MIGDNEQRITYFAESDHRGRRRKFGIKATDRAKHVYVIGKTGMGKSTLLENMAAQDIMAGNGTAFIDPHGSTAEALLDYVPEERIDDVIYFAPFDTEFPISFNIMEDVGYDKRHLVSSGLLSAFRKIWQDTWSARMEYILTNTLLALLEYPDSTILGVNRMLIDKEYRKKVLEHVTDPVVKSFWVDEFAKYTDRYTQEATPAIQNKVGQFVSNPLIRNIVGQSKSSFDFRKAMDGKKILIMNLSKGRMGDTNAQLIGSMLIIKIYLAAMSRADTPASEMRALAPFYFFVDEFQAFANETFADILSESRKYKLNLTIAHQYIEQMPEEVRDAVFGNVGTMVTFRVGAYDAEVLEKEFAPVFYAEDLVNLGMYQIYLKLMIDGLASKPFSATTLLPIPVQPASHKERIIKQSRKSFARARGTVEEQVRKWHEPIPTEKKETSFERDERRGADFRREPRPAGRTPRPEIWRGGRSGDERGGRSPVSPRTAPSTKLGAGPSSSPAPSRAEALGTPPSRFPERDSRGDSRSGAAGETATHRPFEKVFAGQNIHEPHGSPSREKAMSLEALKRERKKDPAPSPENREKLRSALAAALAPRHEDVASDSGGEEKKETPIPEIPESELRAMLDVEKKRK